VRFLKEFAAGAGALLLVLAIALEAIVPERAAYVLSIGGLGAVLLAAGLWLDRERVLAILKGRTARAAGASAGYVLTVLAVVVLVNFLAARHHLKFDATENKAFTLSEQTVKILQSLARDVEVTSFFKEGEPAYDKFKDLIQEYADTGRRLRHRNVDPDKNPGEARRYGITEYGQIVVESGKQESRVTTPDEESLTNALIKVTRDRERIVYVTAGHGERDLNDGERGGLTALKGELEKQHYTVKPLVLGQGVPADASLVLIAGPKKTFLDGEVRMVDEYLERGGRLLYLQDPATDPGLDRVLATYGVAVRKDVVVDKVSRLFGGDYLVPMVAPDGYDTLHPVTKNFKIQTIFPLASSVDVKSELPAGVSATKLAQSTTYSWSQPENGQLQSGRMTLDEKSGLHGPLTIGAAVTRKVDAAPPPEAEAKQAEKPTPPETRLLVFGDSDFLTNAYFNASGNSDLALNGVAWLSEQEELVSIRPKTSTPRILILGPQEARLYFFTIVAFAPIVTVVAGVGIWARRKKL
jgi:ABC-type uncharacterized transport system involved in gliding motility auxiliary subunit